MGELQIKPETLESRIEKIERAGNDKANFKETKNQEG